MPCTLLASCFCILWFMQLGHYNYYTCAADDLYLHIRGQLCAWAPGMHMQYRHGWWAWVQCPTKIHYLWHFEVYRYQFFAKFDAFAVLTSHSGTYNVHLEIWWFFVDDNDDTTDYFTPCACIRDNYIIFWYHRGMVGHSWNAAIYDNTDTLLGVHSTQINYSLSILTSTVTSNALSSSDMFSDSWGG